MKTSSAFSFAQEHPQPETTSHEAEAAKPTLRELHEQYKPIVLEAVTQDIRYHSLPTDHLQPYLDEVSFRFSRRSFGGLLTQRLIHAVACSVMT